MREIIFKAKRKHSPHEWITGDLNHIDGSVFIFPRTEDFPLNSPDWFEVNPSTVCQYTSKNGKNTVKIFEGDIILNKLATEPEEKGFVIVFDNYKYVAFNYNFPSDVYYSFDLDLNVNDNFEVIGNIHD
jgi:hypothetical protein